MPLEQSSGVALVLRAARWGKASHIAKVDNCVTLPVRPSRRTAPLLTIRTLITETPLKALSIRIRWVEFRSTDTSPSRSRRLRQGIVEDVCGQVEVHTPTIAIDRYAEAVRPLLWPHRTPSASGRGVGMTVCRRNRASDKRRFGCVAAGRTPLVKRDVKIKVVGS